MKRIAPTGIVVVAAVVGVAAAYAAVSPKALRASIVAAALTKHSVHWTEHDLIGGAQVSSSSDVAVNSGAQQVTVKANKSKGTIHIVFVSHTVYVEGDAFGLQANLNLTPAQAKKYVGTWISIPKGDEAYPATSAGLTVSSIIHGVTPRGKLKAAKTKSHGTSIFVLEGTKGTGKKRVVGTLEARASGKPLPIASVGVDPAHELISTVDFSKWNEHVNVTAPTSSTPIATVRAS